MNTLVVGLGRMGNFHRRALEELGHTVHTVDTDPAVGADYTVLTKALLENRYEVAAVAVPIPQLVATAYALAGTPMLVEKPFAPTVREAHMLGEYLERRGKVAVGFVERYNPCVRRLRKDYLAGRISVPTTVTYTRWSDRPSPDIVLDLLTHDVDLHRHLGLGVGASNLTFDVRDQQSRKVRLIEIETVDGVIRTDLMEHNASPLRFLWHDFIRGADGVPRPADAVYAIETARTVWAATTDYERVA